jgi:hypothetical protein
VFPEFSPALQFASYWQISVFRWLTDCWSHRTAVKKAILLVDGDLGFLFWLGRALDHVGYEAFPARDVPDVLDLIAEFHLRVSLLVMNCALSGAESLIRQLRESNNSELRVMCLVEPGEEGAWCPVIPPDLVNGECVKPREMTDDARTELVRTVHNILRPRPATARLRG